MFAPLPDSFNFDSSDDWTGDAGRGLTNAFARLPEKAIEAFENAFPSETYEPGDGDAGPGGRGFPSETYDRLPDDAAIVDGIFGRLPEQAAEVLADIFAFESDLPDDGGDGDSDFPSETYVGPPERSAVIGGITDKLPDEAAIVNGIFEKLPEQSVIVDGLYPDLPDVGVMPGDNADIFG